uniref:Uncharacterized protein n=1 Tax=Sphaerodactylus townsendi TaxID=933632 RepID=A0ACB8F3X5_9SAUR
MDPREVVEQAVVAGTWLWDETQVASDTYVTDGGQLLGQLVEWLQLPPAELAITSHSWSMVWRFHSETDWQFI